MATQRTVEENVKAWQEATTMTESVAAASRAAAEFNALEGSSARNLLGRKPALLDLLGAFQAGRAAGLVEEAAKHQPVQEGLNV